MITLAPLPRSDIMRGVAGGLDGEATSKELPKLMRPVDHATARDLRKRRDLLYLYLKHNLKLDACAQSKLLKFASRSARQIRSRISEAERFYSRRGMTAQ
jgi:hypothetical protein